MVAPRLITHCHGQYRRAGAALGPGTGRAGLPALRDSAQQSPLPPPEPGCAGPAGDHPYNARHANGAACNHNCGCALTLSHNQEVLGCCAVGRRSKVDVRRCEFPGNGDSGPHIRRHRGPSQLTACPRREATPPLSGVRLGGERRNAIEFTIAAASMTGQPRQADSESACRTYSPKAAPDARYGNSVSSAPAPSRWTRRICRPVSMSITSVSAANRPVRTGVP